MIQAVVFDIGGILEIVPGGGDPTQHFGALIDRWEARLNRQPGELRAQFKAVRDQLASAGKDEGLGTCTEAEWLATLHHATKMDQATFDAFMRDYWDVYLGQPNDELRAYFSGLRPRYQTALLSNSGVGARREEEARYHYSDLVDLIVYSHEVGVEKPDRRIYQLTCAQLGVPADAVVFLDDVERNVAAAQEYGMHAVLFTDNAQAIAAIQRCLQEDAT